MKKKLASIVAAVMVLTMTATPVFAAESPNTKVDTSVATGQTAATSVAETKSADAYASATKAEAAKAEDGSDVAVEVKATTDTTIKSTANQVQNVLNDIKALGTTLKSDALTAAATDSNKTVSAEIKTVVDVNTAAAVNGKLTLTLDVDGVKAGDTIAVLHYNGTAWETIAPAKVEDGKVTFTVSSLSPIAIVKLSVADKAAAAGASAGTTTSPKTGEAYPVLLAVACACMAGAVVCGRKAKANK